MAAMTARIHSPFPDFSSLFKSHRTSAANDVFTVWFMSVQRRPAIARAGTVAGLREQPGRRRPFIFLYL